MKTLRKRNAEFASPPLSALKALLPKKLPTRGETLTAIGQALKNPKRVIQSGIAKDRAANAVATSMGYTRMGLVKEGAKQAAAGVVTNRRAIGSAIAQSTKKGAVGVVTYSYTDASHTV